MTDALVRLMEWVTYAEESRPICCTQLSTIAVSFINMGGRRTKHRKAVYQAASKKTDPPDDRSQREACPPAATTLSLRGQYGGNMDRYPQLIHIGFECDRREKGMHSIPLTTRRLRSVFWAPRRPLRRQSINQCTENAGLAQCIHRPIKLGNVDRCSGSGLEFQFTGSKDRSCSIVDRR
jgi:hypothetical protein